MSTTDPANYVEENQEILEKIIKHSSNDFVRSLAIAAIIEYGDDATREEIVATLSKLNNCEVDQGRGGSEC